MLKQQVRAIEQTLGKFGIGRSILKALCVGTSTLSPKNALRILSLQLSVRREHGPMRIASDPKAAVVLCVVKDGESLVQAFIEHYLNLGFKHIFFLDNGSTDGTAEIIKSYKQTTLLTSHKPFRQYFVAFKNFLIQVCGRGHWCVIADIDEFLHFPLGRGLKEVLAYLDQHGYDALCIQMLDMFSKQGIHLSAQKQNRSVEELRSTFRYYDISNVNKRKYIRQFQPDICPELKLLYGGIRKTVFNRNCFLTKETMFFAYPGTQLKSSHLLNYANRADFSAVYLHYKFVEDFYAKTVEAVAAENHWNDSAEYKAYLSVLKAESAQKAVLPLLQSCTDELGSIDNLVESGFLFVSDQFRNTFPPDHDLPDSILDSRSVAV
ncbi:MAG: glycosyltransferase family 2 protein [Cyanobacteria bacterium P01_D01_bin.1]